MTKALAVKHHHLLTDHADVYPSEVEGMAKALAEAGVLKVTAVEEVPEFKDSVVDVLNEESAGWLDPDQAEAILRVLHTKGFLSDKALV